ncbi:MAG: sugar ABC transporter ATP-binding protein [Bacteroidota bacterium]
MAKIKLHRISKSFPGVKALDQVDLEVSEGEIHALCGENGAGKSTLMNILTGNLQPNKGTISIDGHPTKINDPQDAFAKGISIVYQHLSLSENLSVAENIYANGHPINSIGFISYAELYRMTDRLLQELQLDGIRPKTKILNLSAAQKQMVEIAKALAKNPSILILDEPTASLTGKEAAILFSLLRALRKGGTAIIYISHRLEEIFMLADKISVLKDGKYQGTWPREQMNEGKLIKTMVGRNVESLKNESHSTAEPLLSLRNLSGDGFTDISFDLARGEILGLAGLVGAGRTPIANAIFGAEEYREGEIFLNGQHLPGGHPVKAIQKGIAYVPEDRAHLGLFLEMSITDNIAIGNPKSTLKKGWYSLGKAKKIAEKYTNSLRIATPGIGQKTINLSGGNQQKVVLGKWLNTDPEVLIVNEPTHGIDVGAKFEIYEILQFLASQGKGILMISSDLPELLGICDTILVINKGKVAGKLPIAEATEEKLMALASY